MSPRDLWARYRKLCCVCDSSGVTLDVSRIKFPDAFLQHMAAPMAKAIGASDEAETVFKVLEHSPSTIRRFAEFPPRRRGNRATKRRSARGSRGATWGMRIERRHAIL